MDITALDTALTTLVDKRDELSEMDYNHEDYDTLEEELHDMEDDFLSEYGDFLEDALHQVHDEFCPDSDVLLPIAYLPKSVIRTDSGGYEVSFKEGVYVDVDDYPSNGTKLVLLPKPTRIVLQVSPNQKEVVWKADK